MSVRFISYFEKFDLFKNQQNIHLKGRNTQRAIFQMVKETMDTLNMGDAVAGLFVDFSKAFDSLNINTMLRKLEKYGVSGIPLSLFRSYFLKQ